MSYKFIENMHKVNVQTKFLKDDIRSNSHLCQAQHLL